MEGFVFAEVSTRYRLITKENPELPHPWEYFPDLFIEEHDRYEKEKLEKDLEDVKQNRRSYAAEFNRRLVERGQ